MRININKVLQLAAYICGAYILYLLLKSHLNFLYYPFHDAAVSGYKVKEVAHQFVLNYDTLPLNMFVFFTAIAGIRSFIVNPAEQSFMRTAIGYTLLGMYEALVAWGLSYVICFFSVLGEQSGYLTFLSKYVTFIAKSSVIAGSIIGIITALLIFLAIPILFFVAILAAAVMLPVAIVMGVLMILLFYLARLLYFVITSCDRLILCICI